MDENPFPPSDSREFSETSADNGDFLADAWALLDSWESSEAGIETYLFSEYLTAMEGFLESQAQKHRKSLNHLIATRQVQYDEETGPDTNYDTYRLDLISSFDDILRKSFFVSLYSFFEAILLKNAAPEKLKTTFWNLKISADKMILTKQKLTSSRFYI